MYDGATRTLRRTINRFKDRAYGASWRADGKLLVAGGEDALVQVFDVESRSILRQLRGHRRPVHVARFDPDRLHVLSGGDDATVRWWDVTSGKQVSRWDGHTDYVRAAAPNPAVAGAWATAGYDHVCKIWDARSAESTLSVNHGAPVEAVAFMPSGTVGLTNFWWFVNKINDFCMHIGEKIRCNTHSHHTFISPSSPQARSW